MTALFVSIFGSLTPGALAELDRAELLERVQSISPTPQTPVGDEAEKQLLLQELRIIEHTPVHEIKAHRTAETCFGSIPADAPRVTEAVRINPEIARWHSTGLYAAPGEVVKIRVPEELVGHEFWIRISGNIGDIRRRDRWSRMPRVARRFPVNHAKTPIASPFGGAIYVDLGMRPQMESGFEVVIENAVKAPMFVLGRDTDQEWIESIRDLPAPYAELVADRIAISLPSRYVRNLESPSEVLEFWDRTVGYHDDLAGHGHLRTFADRINIDVQIAAGAAHAGYPTQGTRLWRLLDIDAIMESGSWGWFHELGHEAQTRPDKAWRVNNYYTFDGGVECTVNIFSTHAQDRHGIRYTGGWGWTGCPTLVMRRALRVAANPDSSFATTDVGTKLAMCLQLRDGFGWETWQEVLRGYNEDFDNGLIQGNWTNQRKRDEFLYRFSKAAGHDLGRWFSQYWRVGVSEEALQRVADLTLPEWMPAVGGVSGVRNVTGSDYELDLAGTALSFDGVAEVIEVRQPRNGTVATTDNGTWVYTAASDFSGLDEFEFDVKSSTGHIFTHTVALSVPVSEVADSN